MWKIRIGEVSLVGHQVGGCCLVGWIAHPDRLSLENPISQNLMIVSSSNSLIFTFDLSIKFHVSYSMIYF